MSSTSKHPDVLKKLREEHNQVLGSDPAAAAEKLTKNPHLVNNLHYTLAVIKEVLRFFPPAGTTRAGKPGVSVTDDQSNSCPTDDAMLWILHVEMHHNAKSWVRSEELLPKRWLVGHEHELYPVPGAWRPFELGPRSCIGQAMVIVDLKLIMGCLARRLDVRPAYEGEEDEKRMYRGERAFQVEVGAAHPVEGYPCQITVV
ncbi:cytochrome P450 [Podospora fimiseda]|uniref:Cytochrome P450 n=1 Tax=Podospora fimiseda TaxID=252190 RepID=A0AAN6YPQ7_9PEZI|nr:cytochrome P450 [Podospora fimiseda]